MVDRIKIPEEYQFLDNEKEPKEIINLGRVNILVGANNSGKSRFMRKVIRNLLHKKYKEDIADFQQEREKTKKFKKSISSSIRTARKDCEEVLNQAFKGRARVPVTPESIRIQAFPRNDPKVVQELSQQEANRVYKLVNRIINPLYQTISRGLHEKDTIIDLVSLKEVKEKISKFQKSIESERENLEEGKTQEEKIVENIIRRKLNEILEICRDWSSFLVGSISDKEREPIVYIPTLRSLRDLAIGTEGKHEGGIELLKKSKKENNDDIYEMTTRCDYFNDLRENNWEIFTGLKLYETFKPMQEEHKKKKILEDFQTFLSERFFNGKSVTLTPEIKENVIYVEIKDEEGRAIHDLGDGVQTIILMTFPLFKYKNRDILLFIEEPETHLHPAMQRKLLQAYCDRERFPNAQVFLTTHSNHLLDVSLDVDEEDISIYSFQKKEEEKFEIKNLSWKKEILELLGVRNSSVFLSNCVIWVEGISDVTYLKKYLEIYQKKKKRTFEEDRHFAFRTCSGSSIKHLNFLEEANEEKINVCSLSKNNFVIVDKDGVEGDIKEKIGKNDDEEKKWRKNLYNLLKSNFYSEYREIENTIPFDIYEKYFEARKKGSWKCETKEGGKEVDWEYDKRKLDKKRFDKEVETVKISCVLKNNFITIKNEDQVSKERSGIGCLGRKTVIARELVKIMEEEKLKFDKLPKVAQELIKKLYKFIEENNQ